LHCIVKAHDGGKPCTDGKQCSTGSCLYRGDTLLVERKSHGGLMGTCAADNNGFGCFQRLVNGKIAESYCAD